MCVLQHLSLRRSFCQLASPAKSENSSMESFWKHSVVCSGVAKTLQQWVNLTLPMANLSTFWDYIHIKYRNIVEV